MKKVSSCDEIRYREFPELKFGKSEDGLYYFDATHFIECEGDIRKHNVRDFDIGFHFWKRAAMEAYSLSPQDIIIQHANGHFLIEESLALLFVAYIDPAFGVYMLERISEMLVRGVVISDLTILTLAKERLTPEDISQVIT